MVHRVLHVAQSAHGEAEISVLPYDRLPADGRKLVHDIGWRHVEARRLLVIGRRDELRRHREDTTARGSADLLERHRRVAHEDAQQVLGERHLLRVQRHAVERQRDTETSRQFEADLPVLDQLGAVGWLQHRLGVLRIRPLHGVDFVVARPEVVSLEHHARRQDVVREPRRRGHERVDHDEQVECAQRAFGLALLGQRDGRVAPVDQQRSHLAFTWGQDLVGKGAAHLLAEQPAEATHAAERTQCPATPRGNHLGLAWQAGSEHARIRHRVTLARVPSADDVEALDQVLGKIRVRTHVGSGSRGRGAPLRTVREWLRKHRRGPQQFVGCDARTGLNVVWRKFRDGPLQQSPLLRRDGRRNRGPASRA